MSTSIDPYAVINVSHAGHQLPLNIPIPPPNRPDTLGPPEPKQRVRPTDKVLSRSFVDHPIIHAFVWAENHKFHLSLNVIVIGDFGREFGPDSWETGCGRRLLGKEALEKADDVANCAFSTDELAADDKVRWSSEDEEVWETRD